MNHKRALAKRLISLVVIVASIVCCPSILFANLGRLRKAKVTFYCRACDPSRRVADPKRRMSSPDGVAADPRYYPLGTLVYIQGYGTRHVDDTGSAIKGPRRFDIRLSHPGKCNRLGVKRLLFRIVKHPKK